MGILDDDDINSNTWDKFSKFMYNNTKFRLNRDYDIAVLLVKPKTKFYNSNGKIFFKININCSIVTL